MTARARYAIVDADHPGLEITIRDVGPWDQHPTVTNDAEAVVEHLVGTRLLAPNGRLFYFDSEGQRDEILVKDGKFAGFRAGARP